MHAVQVRPSVICEPAKNWSWYPDGHATAPGCEMHGESPFKLPRGTHVPPPGQPPPSAVGPVQTRPAVCPMSDDAPLHALGDAGGRICA